MKYWPVSVVIKDPRLTRVQRREIMRAGPGVLIPNSTLAACHETVCSKPACTSMVIVNSEGCPARRVYLKHPTEENWILLERGGFVATADIFGFVMDALH